MRTVVSSVLEIQPSARVLCSQKRRGLNAGLNHPGMSLVEQSKRNR